MTKICTKCGVEKELTEFHNNRYWCKQCETEYRKEYYSIPEHQARRNYLAKIRRQDPRHKERRKQQSKTWRKTFNDKFNLLSKEEQEKRTKVKQEYHRDYYQKNKTYLIQKTKEYVAKNADKIKQQKKKDRERLREYFKKYNIAYRKNNKEKLLAQKREYYKKNKDIIRAKAIAKHKNPERWEKHKNSDAYIKSILLNRSRLRARDVSKELLDTFKLYIRLKREVKNVKASSI